MAHGGDSENRRSAPGRFIALLVWAAFSFPSAASAQPPAPPDPYSAAGGREFVVNGKSIPRALMFRVLPVTLPLPWLRLNSLFGLRNDPLHGYSQFHPGIDLGSPPGAPVYSTAYGRVLRAGWAGDYGNLVEVSHGLGFSTRYGHLSAINVAAGQVVDRNTVLGLVGATGYVTGPHLHYEIRANGKAIDPIAFIVSAYKIYHMQDNADVTAPAPEPAPPPTSGVNRLAAPRPTDPPG